MNMKINASVRPIHAKEEIPSHDANFWQVRLVKGDCSGNGIYHVK